MQQVRAVIQLCFWCIFLPQVHPLYAVVLPVASSIAKSPPATREILQFCPVSFGNLYVNLHVAKALRKWVQILAVQRVFPLIELTQPAYQNEDA